MKTTIIGIDCAADPKKVGLAKGYILNGTLVIDAVIKPIGRQTVAEIVSGWIDEKTKTLLAVDAPLGWPEPLGRELSNHSAGDLLTTVPNNMFRRHTDRFIKETINKQPLDVGADRIARTAHAALRIIHEIKEIMGLTIPLAWDPEFEGNVCAIEVYPAATLTVLGLRSSGYKKSDNTAEREEILTGINESIDFKTDTSLMIENDDVLDAAVCVLAGFHFLNNNCIFPTDNELTKKEGWIWVKND